MSLSDHKTRKKHIVFQILFSHVRLFSLSFLLCVPFYGNVNDVCSFFVNYFAFFGRIVEKKTRQKNKKKIQNHMKFFFALLVYIFFSNIFKAKLLLLFNSSFFVNMHFLTLAFFPYFIPLNFIYFSNMQQPLQIYTNSIDLLFIFFFSSFLQFLKSHLLLHFCFIP